MKKELIINSQKVEIELLKNRDGHAEFIYAGKKYSLNTKRTGEFSSYVSGEVNSKVSNYSKFFIANGREIQIESVQRSRSKNGSSGSGHMQSPMPGKILKVLVSVGDSVKEGDSLIVMEAMKMEHTIKANSDGVISAIHFSEGQQCGGGVDLVDLDS
ncbi:biotin/lipoyl-containing protein [Halobacteriovorax marinus]|uniref:biotin/lipoyl-containing protein n=1 Tax=Halobacteriovorax marinus TaxID=97084 RepID=UPI003A915EC3